MVLYLKVVLNNATVETDNPDLRDRAYIYWRLLSTDPEVCDFVRVEIFPYFFFHNTSCDLYC